MEWYLHPGQPVAPLRHEIRRYLEPRVGVDSLYAIEVIVGELLANVARRSDSGARVHIDWHEDHATLTVIHAGRGYTNGDMPLPDIESEIGFGLWLVQQLGDDLRITCGPRGGTTVSVELPVA